MIGDVLRLMRPRDWVKQVFVLMPVPFALASGATLEPFTLARGVLSFCLASSAVYAYDDALDAELDRQHPDKRDRPVAAGRIRVVEARGLALLLLALALLLGLATRSGVALGLVALYALLNLVYGHFAKHVPLLDVFVLSSGFLIRVFLGCALMGVDPSNWLLLCSSALALFLALTKRRADLLSDGVLTGYTTSFLDQAMGIAAGIAWLAYALYCLESGVFLPGREFTSLPFVAFGILDYLRLAHTRNLGGSPVEVVTTQPSIPLCGIGWSLAVGWSLGLGF